MTRRKSPRLRPALQLSIAGFPRELFSSGSSAPPSAHSFQGSLPQFVLPQGPQLNTTEGRPAPCARGAQQVLARARRLHLPRPPCRKHGDLHTLEPELCTEGSRHAESMCACPTVQPRPPSPLSRAPPRLPPRMWRRLWTLGLHLLLPKSWVHSVNGHGAFLWIYKDCLSQPLASSSERVSFLLITGKQP